MIFFYLVINFFNMIRGMIWISTWRLKGCLDPAGSPVGCLHFLLFLDGFHWGLDERMRMDGNLFENSAQRKEAFGFLAERAYWQTLTGPSVDAEKVKNRHSMWYRYILYNIFLLKWCIFNISLTWLRFSLACFFGLSYKIKLKWAKDIPISTVSSDQSWGWISRHELWKTALRLG